MINRLVTKEKLVALFVVLIIIVTLVYYNLYYIQQSNGTSEWAGDRCVSELTSIKFQLNVVTEYKNKIDKLLTETEKQHKLDKERFQEIMESCFAIKQQSLICQSQFEDLQNECRKIKDDYGKLREDYTDKNKKDR